MIEAATTPPDDAPPALGRGARAGLLVATLAGLLVAAWVVGSIGPGAVASAARQVGVGGFLVYCGYSLGVFAVLGAAWVAAAPDAAWRRVPLFAWARLVREAVSDLLPFAQLGGLVVGARVLIAAGIAPARVYASMTADITTEMASQLIFTLFGLALMASTLLGQQGAALRPLVLGGTLGIAMVMAAFVVAQRRVLALAVALARLLLPGAAERIAAVERELARSYARRGRTAAGVLLNLAGWIGTAAGSWLLLRLGGRPIGIWSVLSLESLIFTARSVAFAVPGAIGVQEAAYALAGPLFGLPAEAALALSLGKRARELALSLPALAIWQLSEARAVLRR